MNRRWFLSLLSGGMAIAKLLPRPLSDKVAHVFVSQAGNQYRWARFAGPVRTGQLVSWISDGTVLPTRKLSEAGGVAIADKETGSEGFIQIAGKVRVRWEKDA